MQSDNKQIYKLTSERTGKSEQMYKDLGTLVFTALYKHVKRPKSLIAKLKGIGTWHLRKNRMDIIVDLFPPNFDKKPEEFSSSAELFKHENKIEVYNIFKQRLEDYKRYIAIRNETRVQRYKNQKPIIPPEKG